eukprot:TRINITY_DN2963_c0_g1_i3.p1 TRINITY_DN2963_c0_g1~~TRINITY_DN2963_c0_g1_i3.p1  ORF type:complete len:813 (-),score=185.08 TRINITY_DN2963_c0_g1_i3:109-2547(-)
MKLSWSPKHGGDSDKVPPWVQHSHLQAQQELCAKRFLRFASLLHVHAAVAMWCLTLWRHGIDTLHAWAPLMYFTAPVLFKHRLLPSCSIEYLSVFILAMNTANAVHLTSLALNQGRLMLSTPLYACLPLSRILFGLFTQEVHWHVLLSTAVALVTAMCNEEAFATCGLVLAVTSCLIIELTAVVVLAGGPCGYEEAILHLAQCRLQHQLTRSQAIQRIDVEREELSGQLLSIATEVIAELTASVQRASDPVLSMLKASCATGTKSAQEVERIGRIGEDLQSEVAELLRHKTHLAWSRLQDRAKERIHQLEDFSRTQQAASQAMLKFIHSSIGRSLAEMHELELEAETSLNQLVQGEINRAMEIADARMDLVRQSAQAMERRVSDTVEVLLSLLKYFGSKGGNYTAPPHASSTPRLRMSRSTPAIDNQAANVLPSIEESLHGEGSPTSAEGLSPPAQVDTPNFDFEALLEVKESEEQGHISPRSSTVSLLAASTGSDDANEGLEVVDGEVEEEVDLLKQFPQQETRPLPGGRLLLLPRAKTEAAPQEMQAESSCDDRSAFTEDESDREVDRKAASASAGDEKDEKGEKDDKDVAKDEKDDKDRGGHEQDEKGETDDKDDAKDEKDEKDDKDCGGELTSDKESSRQGEGEAASVTGAARGELTSDTKSPRQGEGEAASDRDDSSSVRTGSFWRAWSPTSQSSLPSVQRKMQSPSRGFSVPREVFDRHPLFSSRLCYQSEDFFWSWASSADFRAETDALRAWRRAETMDKEKEETADVAPAKARPMSRSQSSSPRVWPKQAKPVWPVEEVSEFKL